MSEQFLRKATLLVADRERSLDLSHFRFTFKVQGADVETPNTVAIRVYNLSDQTAYNIQREYSRVILQAGYEGAEFGVIFDGTLKQIRRGRESATDNYLDLLASDGDIPYNFAYVRGSMVAGASQEDVFKEIAKQAGLPISFQPDALTGGTLPRGKVLWGLFRDQMRTVAETTKTRWSIQNGTVQVISSTSYMPGEAVVLTAQTGMVGVPQQTQQGIRVRCLLNPRVSIGTRVKIDNKSIQRAIRQINRATESLTDAQYSALATFASIAADGFYRTLVVEHAGDTRGNEWYSDVTCLSIDPTVAPALAVKEAG